MFCVSHRLLALSDGNMTVMGKTRSKVQTMNSKVMSCQEGKKVGGKLKKQRVKGVERLTRTKKAVEV